jgi:hypothetical protein
VQANATLQGLAPGSTAVVEVPLASGVAPVGCSVATGNGQTTCTQMLAAAPAAGAPVIATVGGQPVAQGAVVNGGAPAPGPPGTVMNSGAPAPAPPGSPVGAGAAFLASTSGIPMATGWPAAGSPASGASGAPPLVGAPPSVPAPGAAPGAAAAGRAPVLAGVVLAPSAGASASGACAFAPAYSSVVGAGGASATCLIQGLNPGQAASIALPGATSGGPLLACPPAPSGGSVLCSDTLPAVPTPGGAVAATLNGQSIAQGTVAAGPPPLPAPPRATAGAVLQPLGTLPVDGVVNFSPGANPSRTIATASLSGLGAGQAATINVPLVNGPPAPLVCTAAAASGLAACSGVLAGAPLQGAPVTASVNSQPIAQGPVAPGAQPASGAGGPLFGGPALPALQRPLAGAPPPAPSGLLIPGGPPMASVTAAGVPIIPEADSLALVALGLGLVAALALRRHWPRH